MRIIRSGIGIEEHANVELSGIKALFTLRYLSELDNYLVASFMDETHLLKLNGEELEDTEIHGKSHVVFFIRLRVRCKCSNFMDWNVIKR